MKKFFVASVILPVISFLFMILRIYNVIDWEFNYILIPIYIWLIILGIMVIVWLIKECKDDDRFKM